MASDWARQNTNGRYSQHRATG